MSFIKHHNNHRFVSSPLLRSILNYTLLVLLSLSFYTQHVLPFSQYERDNYESRVAFHFNSSGRHSNVFLDEEFPSQELFTAVEMELEEEDDFFNASAEDHSDIALRILSNELLYQSLIRTRYLQLVSNFEQQPTYPLFVLNHSWKYSIS